MIRPYTGTFYITLHGRLGETVSWIGWRTYGLRLVYGPGSLCSILPWSNFFSLPSLAIAT